MKRLNHKKNLYKSIILLVILAIGIGYAYLTSNLSITGSTEVVANTWDIHFENLQVTTGSVTATTPASIDSNETSIEYAITLSRPKDFYEFTVDVVNEGTLPGKISISELSGLDATSSKIIDYSVNYSYGMPVQVNDILNGGVTKTIKIRVYYKDDITEDDLPDNNLSLNLTYTLQYLQSEKDEVVTGTLLQNLSSSNSCIKKYEGQVTDRVGVTEVATNVYFDGCSDKKSIIFGGFCWEIIRTTETGGIKMIYNGEPVDGKCESTRENHKGIVQSNDAKVDTINSNYLYGNSFTYDITNNNFTLTDTITATWNDLTYENLIGKFTCKSSSNTCTKIYEINSYDSSTSAYVTYYTIADTNYAQIGRSSYNANSGSPAMVGYMFNKVYNRENTRNNIEYTNNNVYSYGDSYSNNGDGTYTINNATMIDNSNYYSLYSRLRYKYICKNPVNDTCADIWYVTYSDNNHFYYYTSQQEYFFFENYTYSNGIYNLSGDNVSLWDLSDSTSKEDLKTHRYTCWNSTGICSNMSYLFLQRENIYYYVNIDNGSSLSEALVEMLSSDDVNRYNSSIKGIVDAWYGQNLSLYTNMLEDTLFCNARNISSLGGWDSNGTNLHNTQLTFKNKNSSLSLTCLNDTDQFATSNSKAKLIYPVALLQEEDWYNVKGMISGDWYWKMSPSYYDTGAAIRDNFPPGYASNGSPSFSSYGIRPVISLASFNTISSGTGSAIDPWVIE